MSEHLDRNALTGLTVKGLLLNGLQVICLACWFAQLVIDGGQENIIATSLVVASSSLVLQYLRLSQAMVTQPLTSFALLGFTASSQLVALISQTIEWVAFTQYLRAPVLTFQVLATAHAVVVLAHFTYRHFAPLTNASSFIGRKILSPLNAHRIPTPTAIWMLSGVGLVAVAFGGGVVGDVGGKILGGFIFLIWLPYLIPIYIKVVGPGYCNQRLQYSLLIGYTVIIMILALVKNGRAMLFAAPVQLTFMLILESCRVPAPLSRRAVTGIVGAALGTLLLMPALSDMVTAMELARAKRATATPQEIIEDTVDAFFDKDRLRLYKEASHGRFIYTPYDENYLSNPLLARFTETKFHDNMIYFGSALDDAGRDTLIENQIGKTLAIIPQNFFDFLEIKYKKTNYEYSSGDFYLHLDHGARVGGYATGSVWADLYVIFGIWFPVALFTLITISFILLDANSRFGQGMFICPTVLCSMWSLYLYGIGGESLSYKILQITRGFIQPIILYGLVTFTVFALLQFFQRRAFVQQDATPSEVTPKHRIPRAA
jgi:hypothetical protein